MQVFVYYRFPLWSFEPRYNGMIMALRPVICISCPDCVCVSTSLWEIMEGVPASILQSAQNVKVKFLSITRQVLGRPVCDRGTIPWTLVQWNVVRSRLLILINEEINEANWMVSNIAKLDRRTNSTLNLESLRVTVPEIWPGQNRGEKKNNEANWMVSNSAKLDSRTKQHTQSWVSTSDGSRDMAPTKSWQKKNKKITKRIGW